MINPKNFDSPTLTWIYLELMENRLSSSGIFSFPGRSLLEILQKIQKKTCKIETLNLRILKTESSSCQCSMTSIRRREAMQEDVFQIPNKSRITPRGHWTFLGPRDEKKWYGALSYTLEGKWNSIATQMVGRFKETGHAVFNSISALSRGILKRKGSRETTRFNADSSNTELLFRTIHSANQLSIYGAVSSWCIEFAQRTPNQKRVYFGKVLGKRKRAAIEKCAVARWEFFVANSKVRQTGIWKQIARMSSEIRNTGERYPIDESLWISQHSGEESLSGWATKLFLT